MGRKEQVTTRVLIAQSKTRDTDRSDGPMPGGAGFLEPLASDPFDRHRSPKRIDESADRQFFNGNLAIGSLNQRSAKETLAGSIRRDSGDGLSCHPIQPSASAFFDSDASMGKLTTPVAATFPAVRAEIPRNCLRDEFVTCTSWLTKRRSRQKKKKKKKQV